MATSTGAAARQAVIDDTDARRARAVPGALGGHRRVARSALHDAARREHPRRAAGRAAGGRWLRARRAGAVQRPRPAARPRRQAGAASRRSRPRSGTRCGTPGSKLGHAVRTLDDQLDLAKSDLDTATALLTARLIAGDAELAAQVIDARARQLDEAPQAVARRAPAPGARTPGSAPARSRTCSSPTSRTATAASATCSRCGGRRTPGWRCRAGTPPPLDECYDDAACGARVGAAPRHRSAGRRAAPRGPGRGGRRARGTPTRRRADGRRRRGRPQRSPGSPTRRGAGSSARSVASPSASRRV